MDLLEGTKSGSVLSWLALLWMLSLFFYETRSFLQPTLITDLALDKTNEKKLRVNFNITMLDLKCDYAAIDVVSVLGKEQNVTKNVQKWTVDAAGITQRYVHRNKLQHDIELVDSKVTSTIEELHANGEDAVSLDSTTLEYARREHQFVFVDFFANWCSHCRALAPTWETFAEVMLDAAEKRVHKDDYTDEEYQAAVHVEKPALIAKVDCVHHGDLCREQVIMGYPTLRLFVNGDVYGDYRGHRTVMGLTNFVASAEESFKERGGKMLDATEAAKIRMNVTEEERQWAEALEKTRHSTQNQWNPDDHPGCQLSGVLLLDRAPSHFYIQARSPNHDLAPAMTNVSHIVHRLTFGDRNFFLRQKAAVPTNFLDLLTPMNGNAYVTPTLHQAHHHYLKLVATNMRGYQILQSSQLAQYKQDMVPEAKFIVDLSPIAVSYRQNRRKWYDYLTSLMAIIGGTFTVVGMLEGGMRVATRSVGSKRRGRY